MHANALKLSSLISLLVTPSPDDAQRDMPWHIDQALFLPPFSFPANGRRLLKAFVRNAHAFSAEQCKNSMSQRA